MTRGAYIKYLAQLAQVLAAGGYWFDLGAISRPGAQRPAAMCLFLPAGWWHWLESDAEWHVAWSGSFFPDADQWTV